MENNQEGFLQTGPLELLDGTQLGILGMGGNAIGPLSLERLLSGVGIKPEDIIVPLEVSNDNEESKEIPGVDQLTGMTTGGTNNTVNLKLANNEEASLVLDIDRNGRLEALVDGMAILLHLFGNTGEVIADRALSPDSIRTDPAEIKSYLDGLGQVLDVDGDGQVMALTDGLLIILDLFGFSGQNVLANAIAPGAPRDTVEAVTAYLDELKSMTLTPEPPGENQAPVLQPVGDLEVMPGGRLAVQLQATDPNGDAITFSLGNSSDLPTGMLEGNGILVFTPTTEELGTYNFTIIASDGELEATEEVTLEVIPDTVTTTRISGTIQNTEAEPLAGVPIELGNLQTVTGADGSFTIEITGTLPDDTLKLRGEEITGDFTYPFVAEKLPLLLGRDLLTGVNNVIGRPIYLPALDTENGVEINPAVNTMVTTDAIPGMEVFVAAGTLESMDGGLFTGELSITEVPRDLTPASLPENLLPDLVVTVQPGEMVFNSPAPMTFPNNAEYAPGEMLDLWSINPNTGEFEIVGEMQVSSDGSVIETISGGIRNSSWHFPAPPPDRPIPPDDNPRTPNDKCPDCKGRGAFTSEVEFHSGAVIETHDLVSYQSLGTTQGLTLTYDSLRADPRPIVHFGYNDVTFDPGRRLQASLAVSRDGFVYQVPGGPFTNDHYWSIPAGGGDINAALQADMRSLPSGQYDYTLWTGIVRESSSTGSGGSSTGGNVSVVPPPPSLTGTLAFSEGKLLHVNTTDSAFGSGWGLAGWQEIVENPDGSVLIIDGSGAELLFEIPAEDEAENNAGYISPPGDFSTLEKLSDGTFRRTLKDRTVYSFNPDNKLAELRDRNGNQTQFLYNGSGQLTSIIDPVGLETTLTYSNDRVTAITDPAGRVTEMEYDLDGNLTSITDPDGTSRTFEYDNNHHLIAETDKRGNREETFYDFAGRADRAILKDGSVIEVDPAQVQGLYEPAATAIAPFEEGILGTLTPAPAAFQLSDEAESTYVDPNGNSITYILDRAGQIVSSFDEVGALPVVQRNEDNLVDRQTNARGNVTTFAYDEQGNLTEIKDDISAGAGIVRGDISVPGEEDVYTFEGTVGQTIYYDGLERLSGLVAQLFSPSGDDLLGSSGIDTGSDSEPLTLIETGTYELQIDAGSSDRDATGDYSFRIIDVDAAPTIERDTTQSGRLEVSETDIYQFQGVAGQQLTVDFSELDTVSASSNVTIYGPGNQIIGSGSVSTNFDTDFTLPADGTYSLRLRPNSSDVEALDYSFQLVTGDIVTPEAPDAIPITVGETVSDGFEAAREQDFYSFSGTVGQGLYIDNLGGIGGFSLISPSGAEARRQVERPFTLTETGTYQLVAGDSLRDNSGAVYSFRLLDVADAPTIDLDTIITGSLDIEESQLYRFEVTEGQEIIYDGEDGSLTALLYLPSNERWNNTVDSAPVDGTYLLELEGSSTAVDYSFELITPETTIAELTLGEQVTGTIEEPREEDIFTFEGTAGQRLYYDSIQRSGVDLSLVSPSGDTVISGFSNAGNDRNLFTLKETGTYQLIFTDFSDLPEEYDFRLLDLADAPTLALDSPITGNIPGRTVEIYQFEGLAGQELTNEGSLRDGFVELYGPGNQSITGLWRGELLTLPGDGIYALVLDNGNNIDSNDYDLEVITGAVNPPEAPVTTPLTLGETVSGSFSEPGGEAIFSFEGTAGQQLYYDGLVSESNNIDAFLVSPSGERVFSSSRSSSEDVELFSLIETGTYQLQILADRPFSSGDEDDIGDYSFRLLNVADIPTIDLNSTINDTLPVGQTNLYKFAGTAGQRIFVDKIINQGGSFTIYGPGSQFIEDDSENFSSGIDNFELIVPADGIYILAVAGSLSANGPVDLNFQVVTPDRTTVPINLLAASDSGSKRFTYDPVFNQLTSERDELGRQILYDIDEDNGNVLSITQVVGDLGGNDDLVTEFVYTSSGLVDTVTDPLDRLTDFDYDEFGRLVEITFADAARQQFEYDVVGNVTASIDENGNRTELEYDLLNRLVRTRDALGNETSFTYDPAGNLLMTTDALGQETKNEYDLLDRLTRTVDALDNITSFNYDSDGNLLSIVDALNRETKYVYDARDRTIETIDPDEGRTQFGYDSDNNRISVIDAVGNETTFAYDARDRLIGETDPLGNSSLFEYDIVDNLIAKTDRNGRRTEFRYDDINRPIAETWVDDGNVIQYSYDRASNLTGIADSFSSLAFTYDDRDRVLTENNAGTPNAPEVLLEYSYDAVGNLLSVVDTIDGTAGGTNSYSYDALNRLTELTQAGNGIGDKRVDFSYNAIGQFTAIDRYSNLSGSQLVTGTTFAYDELNRLTSLGHNNGTTDIAFYNFSYDAVSQINQLTNIDGATDYNYDNRGQLITANNADPNNPDESYNYDANGNRTGNDYETGEGNRLLSDGTYNYEYDNEGNRIRRTEIATGAVQEYDWDYRNRMIASVDKDAQGNEIQRVDYTYDALDRRIAKETNGAITYFAYNGEDVLLEFVDEDGTDGSSDAVLNIRYLQGPEIDQVLAQEEVGGDVIWHLSDHLGTVRDLVDNSGTVVNHLTYDSFGNVVSETNAAVDTRYLFAGREFDEELGLYYYRARYYDPRTGSFVGEDPIKFDGGGTNLYSYTLNNPVSFVDPDGLLPVPIITGAIGAVVGAISNAAGQIIDNGGFDCFNIKDVLVSAGVGAISGALGPLATTVGRSIAIGAGANVSQEVISDRVNNRETTLEKISDKAITGAIGGVIAGPFSRAKIRFDESGRHVDKALARSLNRAADIGKNVTKRNLARNLGGALASSNIDPGGLFPSGPNGNSCAPTPPNEPKCT